MVAGLYSVKNPVHPTFRIRSSLFDSFHVVLSVTSGVQAVRRGALIHSSYVLFFAPSPPVRLLFAQ